MKKVMAVTALILILASCSPYRAATLSLKDESFGLGDPNAPVTPGAPVCTEALKPKAIYGEDNRLDWFETSGIERDYWAQATLALMPVQALVKKGDYYRVTGPIYGDVKDLCPGVAFADQPKAAFCSGFLVAEDLVVTAGHCISGLTDCRSTRFVFNFAKRNANQTQYNIAEEDVYNCSQVVSRSMSGTDYAVIRLDREVIGRTPLNLRRQGRIQVGEELVLIGHPTGIPSKIAGGGVVYSNSGNIVAGVDAFAGNSGSAVINAKTGEVEGILVAGEPDFTTQGTCNVEYRCDEKPCSGEIITATSDFSSFVPDIRYEAPELICP